MGLSKEIELDSGVKVAYHRVANLNIATNVANNVTVASYTSAAKREEERAAVAEARPCEAFISYRVYETPYDQSMTVESAYAYLKELPEFEGALDVPEGGGADSGAAE